MTNLKRFDDGDDGNGSGNQLLSVATSVDVEGVSDDQRALYATIAKRIEENFQLLVEKNSDYGSVFIRSAVSSFADGTNAFDDIETEVLYRLYVRTEDKRGRFSNQQFNDGEDLVGETDTPNDCSNYWLLMAEFAENGAEHILRWIECSDLFEVNDPFGEAVHLIYSGGDDLYDEQYNEGDILAQNIFND